MIGLIQQSYDTCNNMVKTNDSYPISIPTSIKSGGYKGFPQDADFLPLSISKHMFEEI